MKKKLIVIAVAVVAILLIAYFGIGRQTIEKYSYGTDMADLDSYYEVSGDERAIIVQDARIGYKAISRNQTVYFPFQMIEEYFGSGFFYDPEYNGGTLMFTTAVGTYETVQGVNTYTYATGDGEYAYPICFVENGNLYIAGEFAKLFFTFTYEDFDKIVQVYTQWDNYVSMEVTSDTQIRVTGGIKSEILREVKKGETVELLEEMETWSKVKTSDSFIGYIENKRLKNAGTVTEASPIEPSLPEYDALLMDTTVVLGFHSIGGVGGNDTIYEMMREGQGMNVIAPTWFSLNDNVGGFRNFGSTDYVKTAHNNGLLVWGVIDDFNYQNETGNSISIISILGNTENRRALENNIVNAAISLGLDGINIDFEKLNSECGDYFAQFLKELSILTHANNLVLSVDNYVPFNYNEFYRLDVQGQACDYVIIMGYDEHYHGSGDPGSVASFEYVSSGIDKTLNYVASEKIINALPFYTIVWKVDGSSVTDSYLTLNNQADYIQRLGITYEWDEITCQNYAEWTSSGVTYMVWLEDEESISAKLNVMKTKEIGGAAVWRLGYGTASVWNIIALYAQN